MGEAVTEVPVDVIEPKPRSESTFPDPEPKGAAPEGGEPDAAASEEAAGEAEKAVAPKPKQKYKIKDTEYDEDALSEALTVAQKRKEHTQAANKRFEEASALIKKEVEPVKALIAALKKDPMALFEIAKHAGISPEEAVAKFAEKFTAREKLTPEQRAAEERMEQIAAKERDISTREAALEEARLEKEADGYRMEFSRQVGAILPKFDLGDDPLTVNEIGRIVAGQIRAGMEPDYEVAAEMEAERIDEHVKRHLDRLARTPGALLKKYPELAKKLREEEIAAATAPRQAPKRAPSGKPVEPRAPETPKVKSWADDEADFRRSRFGLSK
jgi:hypothetical protein